MLKEFPEPIGSEADTPAADNLSQVSESPALDKTRAEVFHTHVAKALHFCKRAMTVTHDLDIDMVTQ